MKRSEIRSFLEDGVNLLSQSTSFNSGRLSEFSSEENKKYPYVWVSQLQASVALQNNRMPINTWAIVVRIGKLDSMDSLPDQYETLVDDCDLIAQKLIKQYNLDLTSSKLITLDGITRTPFYKQHADVITGVDLSFSLIDSDTTDLC